MSGLASLLLVASAVRAFGQDNASGVASGGRQLSCRNCCSGCGAAYCSPWSCHCYESRRKPYYKACGSVPSDPGIPPPTPPPISGCLELLVIGDYGTRDSRQASIAEGLASVASARDPAAIIAVGDNIYRSGAEGSEHNIVNWWANVYLKHSSLNRRWDVITGNHDWYTDARTERDFTWSQRNIQRGGYWQMPGFWYKKSFSSSSSGVSVDAFYIDTVIWRGSRVVDRSLHGDPKQEQLDWLRAALQNSSADWKIVLGHHPVYSAGSHGMSSTLLRELDPMLRQYGVPLYLAGHDHSKQVIYWEGVNYVISGAGGARPRRRSNEYPAGSLQHYFPDGGFVGLTFCNKQEAHATIYDADGVVQAVWPVENSATSSVASYSNTAAVKLAAAVPPILPASHCGLSQLKSVDRFCSTDGCQVLPDQGDGSCHDFCLAAGLHCARAWEQGDGTCSQGISINCMQNSTELFCECTSVKSQPVFLP